jgi:hypothetical protein
VAPEKEPLPVHYPSSEQSARYYEVLKQIYYIADDAAYAGAYLELELVQNKAAQSANNGDDETEVPEEFDSADFQRMCTKLLKLRMLKEFCEAFELGAYSSEIMSTNIAALFGKDGGSTSPKGNYFGSDEGFLLHQIKNNVLKGRQG